MANLLHSAAISQMTCDGQRLAAIEARRESGGNYSTNWITWSNDALRRLVKETSISTMAVLNYTNNYVYDLAGNRLWKTNSPVRKQLAH